MSQSATRHPKERPRMSPLTVGATLYRWPWLRAMSIASSSSTRAVASSPMISRDSVGHGSRPERQKRPLYMSSSANYSDERNADYCPGRDRDTWALPDDDYRVITTLADAHRLVAIPSARPPMSINQPAWIGINRSALQQQVWANS